MQIRTDLALERAEVSSSTPKGVEVEEFDCGTAHVSRIVVKNEQGAEELGKPVGRYITVEVPPLSDHPDPGDELVCCIKNELATLIPKEGPVLFAGLGNTQITPDALGPKTAESVLATRHIGGEFARTLGLSDLRSVAVLAPGVLGQTGMETGEILEGMVKKIRPAALIVVDALASRRLARLGCTIQMSDTGITPGSGVGNARKEISRRTLGIPVIAVGIPTVVDAATLCYDLVGETAIAEPRGAEMIVTPKEIDLLIDRAAKLLGHAINCALQSEYSPEVLLSICM